MCGIVGIVDSGKLVGEDLVVEMRDALTHRGPDDAGVWINKDRKIALAHRRLSVIDLSRAGRQPMSDDEGKILITYNGEIYNFQEIRKELEKRGYRFRTRTDTEVIIYAYKEWGVNCLQRFNGMFALGIYDDKKKIIFLARDRVGKKPLYYAQYNSKFVFVSELKALTRDPEFPKEIDLNALNFYFAYGYIPGELCIFAKVKKLLPAHALTYDLKTKEMKRWRYWQLSLDKTEEVSDEEQLLGELEYLLEDATKLRMISDVPLGVFLSGGVDSSLVTAMMARVSDKPVRTFSIGFEEKKYDELSYAQIVARYFSTNHHEFIVKPDAIEVLPELVKQFDEPFADSSLIPTYYVSREAKQEVTVALSGDGGDELFGGYQNYFQAGGDRLIARVFPSFFRNLLSSAGKVLPDGIKGKNSLLRLGYNEYDAFVDINMDSFFKISLRREIFEKQVLNYLGEEFYAPELYRKSWMMNSLPRDFLEKMTYSDYKVYLPDDILVKVDRASMLVSLEIRAPLLDYRIAEFSYQKIPARMKLKGFTKKYLLKKLARRLLPRELNLERKQGFAIPIKEWFKNQLGDYLKEILVEGRNEFINHNYPLVILERHKKGIDETHRLFSLLMFELWRREYCL